MTERDHDPSEAQQIATNYFELLRERSGIDTKVRRLSDVNDPYPTTTCAMTHDDRMIIGGHGKGFGIQSNCSAMFETLEHLYFEPYYFLGLDIEWVSEHVEWANPTQILSQSPELVKSTQFRNLAEVEMTRALPCVRMHSLVSDGHSVLVPIAFLTPSYPWPVLTGVELAQVYDPESPPQVPGDEVNQYEDLYHCIKYSSSNGAASGLNDQEAPVHAINEVIERDAQSLFYIRRFSKKDPNAYALIDPETLPDVAANICESIEHQHGLKVLTIDITSDTGISTFGAFAYPKRDLRDMALAGFGTSTDSNYAMERALLELKQVIELDPELALVKMKEGPLIQCYTDFHKDAYYFRAESLETDHRVPFDVKPGSGVTSSALDSQLASIARLGHEVYAFSDSLFASEIKIAKVIVPGFEELLACLHVKMPSARGLNVISPDRSINETVEVG